MKSFTSYYLRSEKDLYYIQENIAHPAVAVAKLADKAINAKNNSKVVELKQFVKDPLDAILFLGQPNVGLTNKRKSNLRNILALEVRTVCSAEHEASGELLGNNLSKKLKEAKQISRISNTYAYSSKRRDYDTKQHRMPKALATISKPPRPVTKSFLEKGRKPQTRENDGIF